MAPGMNTINGLESSHVAFYCLLGGSAAASAMALGGVMRHLRCAGGREERALILKGRGGGVANLKLEGDGEAAVANMNVPYLL